MRIKQTIPLDAVICEWLRAERDAGAHNRFRWPFGDYSQLILAPDLQSERENETRRLLMAQLEPHTLPPLLGLGFRWYTAAVEGPEEYQGIFTCPSVEWFLTTSKEFRLSEAPKNLNYYPRHQADVMRKRKFLEQGGKFGSRIFLVGSRIDRLTILDGNHRALAYLLYGQEKGFDFLPLEVIVGLSPLASKFRWSVEWEGLHELFQLCEMICACNVWYVTR